MNKYLVAGVVAILIIGGGWWYLNQSSVPATSQTTELPAQQNTSTQPSVSNAQNMNGVDTQSQVKPFLVKPGVGPLSLQSSIQPEKEDWLVISANGPDMSVDLTGWTVRSTQSGKSFTIKPLGGTQKVAIGSSDTAVFIHTVGSPTKNYMAEGEWHLYFGESIVAWGKEHDTIQLVNPPGAVIDTYTY